jgi:hypothetical protein
MGMGKRILATVAGLGVLVGGGVKVLAGQADNVPTPKPPAIHVPANPPITLPRLPKIPKPVSRAVSKAGRDRANAVISAGCQLKDSSDIGQDARLLYGYRYSDFEVSLIVELAEAAQTDPEVWAYCDENFPHSN